MKKLIFIFIPFVLFLVTMASCHKLTVTSNSEYTPDVFPTNDAQFQALAGPIYTALRGSYSGDYFFITECSTDEAILPAYGTNWLDGNKYQELHQHTWTKDNAWVQSVYSSATNIVGLCNQTLYIMKAAPEGDAKNTGVAEVKTMRAYAYWMLMDLYGNVALDTVYPATEMHTNATRAQIFSYVESELKAAIPYLKTAVSTATYGKPTRYMAYTLLAKLYLNAKEYTGSTKYNECITACDSVIASGNYSIEGRGTYLSMFYPSNSPTSTSSAFKEFIFVVPYDASTSNNWMFYARYDLNRNLGMKYNYAGCTVGNNVDPVINSTKGNGLVNSSPPSGPRATLGSYLNYFLEDSNDIRLKQWLYGPQTWADGKAIRVFTTKKSYNQLYTGTDDTMTYDLNIDTTITLRINAASFNVGNDEIAWNRGARNIKFYPDASSSSRNQNNDVPVFRYSDVLLMKAEAILRGGTATMSQTALSLVNMVRNNRSTSAAWTSVTLDDLYKERCREFCWENWHRNDMIRFGHYEDRYGFKANSDTYRRLFPLPTIAFTTNTKLTQNTGY